MSAIRLDQIRVIHAIKTKTRLDESSYRAMLQGFGATSSKHLTSDVADRLIARMRLIPGASNPVQRPAKATATGPYAKKLQALWLALYNLAEVRNRTDAAMHRFLEGQARIPHTRFLHDPTDAAAAIEALKDWAKRAGVHWPRKNADPYLNSKANLIAVIVAQWERAVAAGLIESVAGRPAAEAGVVRYASQLLHGAHDQIGMFAHPSVGLRDLITVSNELGRVLRRASTPAEARRVG